MLWEMTEISVLICVALSGSTLMRWNLKLLLNGLWGGSGKLHCAKERWLPVILNNGTLPLALRAKTS
jgi:hypothetical protein